MPGSRIVIDAPDALSAVTLSNALAGRFRVSVGDHSAGTCQVEVDTEHAPYETVVALLNEVERWLDVAGIDETLLELDGRRYRMLRGGRVEPRAGVAAR